jgi:hypothetical protein
MHAKNGYVQTRSKRMHIDPGIKMRYTTGSTQRTYDLTDAASSALFILYSYFSRYFTHHPLNKIAEAH